MTYFKRYRMELELRHAQPAAVLPPGFWWLPWHDSLLDAHAEVKSMCFQNDLDSVVFPNLGHLAGCRELMTIIRNRIGFCPAATWLVVRSEGTQYDPAGGCVGTVQGVLDGSGRGAIQNLGVMPEYRGRGIGRALLLKAMSGFTSVGARYAMLEVTARNEAAVRMYRSMGFRSKKTLYRGVDVPDACTVGAGL